MPLAVEGNPGGMAPGTGTMRDHDEVRRWVEAHDGTADAVRRTGLTLRYREQRASGEDSSFCNLIRE